MANAVDGHGALDSADVVLDVLRVPHLGRVLLPACDELVERGRAPLKSTDFGHVRRNDGRVRRRRARDARVPETHLALV